MIEGLTLSLASVLLLNFSQSLSGFLHSMSPPIFYCYFIYLSVNWGFICLPHKNAKPTTVSSVLLSLTLLVPNTY